MSPLITSKYMKPGIPLVFPKLACLLAKRVVSTPLFFVRVVMLPSTLFIMETRMNSLSTFACRDLEVASRASSVVCVLPEQSTGSACHQRTLFLKAHAYARWSCCGTGSDYSPDLHFQDPLCTRVWVVWWGAVRILGRQLLLQVHCLMQMGVHSIVRNRGSCFIPHPNGLLFVALRRALSLACAVTLAEMLGWESERALILMRTRVPSLCIWKTLVQKLRGARWTLYRSSVNFPKNFVPRCQCFTIQAHAIKFVR